jgi:hypothetical protein
MGSGTSSGVRRAAHGFKVEPGGQAQASLSGPSSSPDEVAGLLAGPDGTVAPELRPLTEAFTRVRRPFNAISWVRHSPAAGLLRHLAGQQRPVTHDLLDELPPGHSLHYLRQVLVQTGMVPESDEDLERVPAWLEHYLDGTAARARAPRPPVPALVPAAPGPQAGREAAVPRLDRPPAASARHDRP